MYLSETSRENAAIARLASVLVLVLIALATVLIALRIEQVLLDLAQGRALRAGHQLREQVEGGFRLGLSLTDQSQLPALLQRHQAREPSLVAARIEDDQGEGVASLGDAAPWSQRKPVWTAQLLGLGYHAAAPVGALARNAGDLSYVGVTALDASGRRAAVIWLVHDRGALRQSAWAVLGSMWVFAAVTALALAVALTALAVAWLRFARRRMARAVEAAQTDTEAARSRGPAEIVEMVEGGATTSRSLWLELSWLAVAFALVFAALSALAWRARDVARPLLASQIEYSARTILRAAEGEIERALRLGIPTDGLVGVEPMFQVQLQPAPEIAFLAWRAQGATTTELGLRPGVEPEVAQAVRTWSSGQSAPRLSVIGQPVALGTAAPSGELWVGTWPAYLDQRLRSVLLDLALAVVVSLVLVREVLAALWERSALKPYLGFEGAWQGWRARARQWAEQAGALGSSAALDWLGEVRSGIRRFAAQVRERLAGAPLAGVHIELMRIRLVVFLTALSDELLRPFFSVFASETTPLSNALSPTMQAGIPVAAFMLTLALAQPMGPWITQRFEPRRALAVVALLGGMLLALTAFTRDAWVLLALRAASGMVYGLLLILCQTAIVRLTDATQRARGLVEVSAAIVAAGVCGPALGGLLVERLGTVASFGACALCLFLAVGVSLGLAPLPKSSARLSGLGGMRGIAAVMRHRRVMAVTWFAAVPARLAAAALLVVVTPLYLAERGEPANVVGRVLLLYFLVFMVAAPLVAWRSDLARRRKPWVVAGCVMSALACAALPLVGGVGGAALCCALLGLGQAMLSAPQLALVTETFDRDPHATQVVGATPEQALAAFRFIERFGSILAPFAVAAAVGVFGLGGAVGTVGALLAAGALALVAALWNFKESEAVK